MIDLAFKAFMQMFSAPFRGVLLKTIGLSLLLVMALSALVFKLTQAFAHTSIIWLDSVLSVVGSLGVLFAGFYLMPAVTMLVASLYLDEIAELVERTHYPHQPVGRSLPVGQALIHGLRFFLVVLGVNLVALLLLLVPGLNLFAFFLANLYLLGREYFHLAAMRFVSFDQAVALRNRFAWDVYWGGFLIAIIVSIPFLNLLTPLFGTALMVHLFKRVSSVASDTAV